MPPVGAPATLHLITYQQAQAVVVPNKALHFEPTGWSVEVKMPDGKIQHQPVKRGRSSGNDTEILEGLEAGQVIVAP